MPLMRAKAGELAVHEDVKDVDIQSWLDAAERRLYKGKTYAGGDTLEAEESVFLLDGLIKLGQANLIVGAPKVGKSSFTTALIGALRDRRETFMGRSLNLPNHRMPVLIFGTDQSDGDWLYFLKREGLVDQDKRLDPNAVDFFAAMDSKEQFNFTREGLKEMREIVEQHEFPLVIIDSLSSMMESTGIEENLARFAQPIRSAINVLRGTGATILLVHHSKKGPTTWDWVAECRGSSSISSVFSWGFLMRYVSQEDDGMMRTDRRVGFVGNGRGSGAAGGVMAEYKDEGGWTFLDGLEAAQQVERVRQRILEIGGVRGQVFDHLTMRNDLGADCCSEEIATELNKTRSNVCRELSNLKSKGLAVIIRKEETGGKPRPYWTISEAAAEALGIESPRKVRIGSFDKNHKKPIESNIQTFREAEQPPNKSTPPAKESTPYVPLGQPVQRLINGSWQPGFLVHEHTAANEVTVTKLGSPHIRIRNLRWDIDVKLADTPFPPAPPESTPEPQPANLPDDFPIDLPF